MNKDLRHLLNDSMRILYKRISRLKIEIYLI